jgi:hypothetical protein
MNIHTTGIRLLVLLGLCGALLVLVGQAAAYPAHPDGEPMYVDSGLLPSTTPSGGVSLSPDTGAPLPSTHLEAASSGTDWGGVAAVVGASVLAVLALVAGAHVLIGYRRRSAEAH